MARKGAAGVDVVSARDLAPQQGVIGRGPSEQSRVAVKKGENPLSESRWIETHPVSPAPSCSTVVEPRIYRTLF